MTDLALYFPTIRYPSSAWANRVLLYWDNIASIVPKEYLMDDNNELDPYTESLFNEKLILPLSPRDYLEHEPSFGDAFLARISALDNAERSKRQFAFRSAPNGIEAKGIHLEKLFGIETGLRSLGLAEVGRKWAFVEEETFHEFMSYLALAMSQLHVFGLSPVTDNKQSIKKLKKLVSIESSEDTNLVHQVDTRNTVLDNVLEMALPAPEHIDSPKQIRQFKERNHFELVRFRNYINKCVTEIVHAGSNEERQDRFQDIKREVEFERAELVWRMKEEGWVVKFCSMGLVVLEETKYVGILFKTIQALVKKKKTANIDLPLAYAAMSHLEFNQHGFQ